jgi:hypothetical protein
LHDFGTGRRPAGGVKAQLESTLRREPVSTADWPPPCCCTVVARSRINATAHQKGQLSDVAPLVCAVVRARGFLKSGAQEGYVRRHRRGGWPARERRCAVPSARPRSNQRRTSSALQVPTRLPRQHVYCTLEVPQSWSRLRYEEVMETSSRRPRNPGRAATNGKLTISGRPARSPEHERPDASVMASRHSNSCDRRVVIA